MTDSSDQDAAATRQDPPDFPTYGRLMGLDYGTKRIGIAVSTPEQTIGSPLENYALRDPATDERHLVSLAEEYRVVGLVVGLPVHMSGDEGTKAREAREFGNWVAELTGLPLCFWDERFTSAMAENLLLQADLTSKKRKKRLDKVAAQIMLQSFLDSTDRTQPPRPLRDK